MKNLLMKSLTLLRRGTAMLVLMACVATLSWAQSQVSGVVTDGSTNEPIPGVNVVVKGTTTGTITDLDGKYTISASSDAVLVFSFIGYETAEEAVSGRTSISVAMKSDSELIDEIVAVGYGFQKKSDLTGSVAKVSSDDIKNLTTTDAAAALQGKAAGVQILNSSGAPGSGASIRVRGYSSNSGNLGPLLIVDGLKVDNIQYLDPSMIQSIEVLKDAASAAIYGAEAGNGVVLVTTKAGNGGEGKSKVTYSFKAVQQSLGKTPEIFGAKDWIAYKEASGFDMKTICKDAGVDYNNPKGTDWVDAVFGSSWATQHSLSFQDGNQDGHFFASINYVENDGIVRGKKDTYTRFTGQVNADYKLYDWIKVGTNTSIEKWSTKNIAHMSAYGSMLAPTLLLDPLTPIYFDSVDDFTTDMKEQYAKNPDLIKKAPNGKYYATSKIQMDDNGNPLLQRDRRNATSGGFTVRGTAFVDVTPLKGLVYTSRLSYRINQSNDHSYEEPYFMNGQAKATEYKISATANTGHYYQWENFINYNNTFGVHNVGAMVGMSFTTSKSDNVTGSAQGKDGEKILKGDAPNFRYLDYVNAAETTSKSIGNNPGKATSMSYFGRLLYSYDSRYSVQFNLRSDAFDSSKLPKESRWGTFPSVSAGWTLSNESFMKDNVDAGILSFAKIRASWGQNGNINVLSNYPYISPISYNASWYQYGDNPNANYGSYPSGQANPDLKWETSQQLDLGLDLRFLNDRLSLGIDYFNKDTKDLLVSINPVPEVYTGSTTVNAGEINNKGIELELSWKDKVGDFSYNVSANMSTLKNEVTYLYDDIERITSASGGVDGTNNMVCKGFEEGHSVWYFRAYDYAGVDKETGAPLFRNAEGKLVGSAALKESDMTDIGSPIPSVTYGITINLEWKGIDFTLFGTGVAGNDIFNILYRADTPLRNSLKYYYDNAWTKDNKGASMPACSEVANDRYFWSSSASLFNGAYFKIKQLQLGYTVPKSITRTFKVNNLRVFLSLDDFFTISKYPGMDPETATTTNNAASSGFDIGTYPTMKKMTFGASISF
ncbi:MAG: TonB-dependent receptor [Bacteroidia bacterium]|nr:TonB-dependent receptor [Bacteroidia bacterium]